MINRTDACAQSGLDAAVVEARPHDGAVTAHSAPHAGSLDATLPDALRDQAAAYVAAARATSTRRAYKRAWANFTAWCDALGRTALPTTPDTIAGWLADMARNGKAPATINAYLAAVIVAHRTAGYPLDRKNALIADTWRGIRRSAMRAQRQARPLTASDLQTLIASLDDGPTGKRDAALLALGWAAALRRSELVGLDWVTRGTGTGFVTIEERGIVITLLKAKTSQAETVTIVIPRSDMPAACYAVEGWIVTANIKTGSPVFRAVGQSGRIAVQRLSDRSVARLIKDRVHSHALALGRSPTDAAAIASLSSGHSLRVGYVTTAAREDVPTHRIMQHTRHKSAEMVTRYVRESEKWSKSGLKGVGF